MHVLSKDSSRDGKSHLLDSVLEADGASELCRATDFLSAKLIGIERTASGGIHIQTEITVSPAEMAKPEQQAEPESAEPEPPAEPEPDAVIQ